MKNTRNGIGRIIRVCDLRREYPSLKREAQNAIRRVIGRGWYILGKELEAFEKEFAAYCDSPYAIGVASGTEALELSLKALSVGGGDEVITAVNTAIPTAMAIVACGARPRFVDMNADTFNIDVKRLEDVITRKTKAIIPVHLYGNPCDIEGVLKVARKHNIPVVEDACQAHGASYKGRKTGTFGDLGAFSFYPTKNLGGYGDGGMVVTNNKKIAERVRSLRNYGQKTRYRCDTAGINSRLDEIQAAVLRAKLRYLDDFNDRRIELAGLYEKDLSGMDEVKAPACDRNSKHVFHLYVIRCENRDGLKIYLLKKGIETEIHYPIPLHLQRAFKGLGYHKGSFLTAENLARDILTLPMFPELSEKEVSRICAFIKSFYGR